ncbi:MAG: hypothetical protein NC187_08060 [Candidatus Amulumruptor caecigallinarius]|nr:hypothetical protein [Candidatus Amulumruptor caecigallinarius]MCM1397423.1 hypothetical protein [Candidatus Amulumruptor caecigallinarius]MCM1454370.1 hypothetical protein [bacterium]
MTVTRKITSWTLVTVLSIPALMVFNDNFDTACYNLIGLAYGWLMVKSHRSILPTVDGGLHSRGRRPQR